MTVANKISMNVTFISPITPTDLKKQSIIGTYLQVTIASIDGLMHAVQLYADTSAGMCMQIFSLAFFFLVNRSPQGVLYYMGGIR